MLLANDFITHVNPGCCCMVSGSSGYDPPIWPPPGLQLVFQYQHTEQVAVVCGIALFIRLGHALLFE